MSGFSDYMRTKIRKHIFKATAYSMPSVLAVSLHKSDPTNANNTSTEVSSAGGSNYARVACNPSSTTNWTEDGTDTGKVSNAVDLTFPTAGTNWGVITYFALYDATTGGNLIGSNALTNSKTINTGDVFKFLAGDLTVTIS